MQKPFFVVYEEILFRFLQRQQHCDCGGGDGEWEDDSADTVPP